MLSRTPPPALSIFPQKSWQVHPHAETCPRKPPWRQYSAAAVVTGLAKAYQRVSLPLLAASGQGRVGVGYPLPTCPQPGIAGHSHPQPPPTALPKDPQHRWSREVKVCRYFPGRSRARHSTALSLDPAYITLSSASCQAVCPSFLPHPLWCA